MFGFSIQKLLFTIAVIVIVWYGFKLIGRLDKKRKARLRSDRRGHSAPPPQTGTGTENLVACTICGTFVSSQGVRSCGRENCPYPG